MSVQLEHPDGPIALVSLVFVPPGASEAFVALWRDDAAFMTGQPGFLSARLHAGVNGSHLLFSVAEWESAAHLAAAMAASNDDPVMRAKAAGLPDGIVLYPHIVGRDAVESVAAPVVPPDIHPTVAPTGPHIPQSPTDPRR